MDDNKLNILFLYTDQFTYIRAVNLDLSAYKQFSRHNIYFAPGSIWNPHKPYNYAPNIPSNDKLYDEFETGVNVWDFSYFDAIVIHYGVRITFDYYLSDFIARKLKDFDGAKILYIQDEYDKTETARKWMDLLQFDIVYTCVPDKYINEIYSSERFPKTSFKNVLTGYVTSDLLGYDWIPIEKRKIDIGYRGRQLPHHYGKLGFEKRTIGEQVREYAENAGLNVDIEWLDEARIYGKWLDFLGSCRATLATESGSNMFDIDGHLSEKTKLLGDQEFEDVYKEHFEPFDDLIQMNQISPKIFESIAVGTLLICFEGRYSGVIKPNIHYLSLKKDFSNIQEIFDKLKDDDFVKQMTLRAYQDIILSGKYHVKNNVERFDADVSALIPSGRKYEIINGPIAIKRADKIEALMRSDINSFLINDKVIKIEGHRKAFLELFSEMNFVTKAIDSKNIPQELLFEDSLAFSKYDKAGNIIPDTIRKKNIDEYIKHKKLKNEIVTRMASSSHLEVENRASVSPLTGKGRKAIVQKFLGKKIANLLGFLWKKFSI